MMYPRASRAAVTLTSCGPITINPFLCAIATMTATAGTMSSSPVASVKEQGRLRVLVIAELANPDWESVPLVGWSHWRALSKIVDGHLVTQIRNEENILKAGEPRERFTALDSTPVERQVDRVGKVLRGRAGGGLTTMTALSALSYYYFEDLLWRRFGKDIAAGKWDVVHRLTPLSPTTPSLLAAKCRRHGVPFVLGPINGGVPRYQGKTVYIPENAVDPARFTRNKSGPVTLPLKVAFVGRFTLYKGADMLLEAAAPLVRAGKVKLDLIGDGMQGASLRALAASEGLPDTLFAGWIKHDKLQERLGESDVLAFPSIREFGGAVVLEAMSLGLVPIVMDYAGPGEIVTPSTGVLLPMASRAEIVAALRGVLERLAADPEPIRAIGQRARARVMKSFTWDAKAAQVLQVYRWVLGGRPKPEFEMPLGD